jgi:glycosyltransferase involved in cell wall biosynthesis
VNILFIHQNFPGQFKHLAPELAARGHRVVALSMAARQAGVHRGVQVVPYGTRRGSAPGVHPWLADFEAKVIRGEACFRAALLLKDQGFIPDVIVAHPGWGESLFLKRVWPSARLGIYCEFFYREHGADTGFDPEFPVADPDGDACRLQLKNLNNLLHFQLADAGISPTRWQAQTFPDSFRHAISVIHDGIDTRVLRPNPDVRLGIGGADGSTFTLTRADEVVTFVNRNLEPYRGYHIFMRSLPMLLQSRPRAICIIVGGSEVSYGARPPQGTSWKQRFIDEMRPRLTEEQWSRVRFVGNLPYAQFIALLQLSTVHVYLTYPFVLSWSLLEAMSIGCAVVASNTEPVREVITHNETGMLVDFFQPQMLARQVAQLLDDPAARERLGTRARELIGREYDLHDVCLPRQLQWVASLTRPVG